MTVRFYQSSDVGAPVLTSAPGSLANVLSKCLVEGYGSKAAAGWTKPYANGDSSIIALRQGGGANRLLRVDDSAAATTGTRSTRMRGYETMTSIDAGNGAFPTLNQLSGGGVFWPMHYTGTATNPHEWVVIADETFFYLFNQTYPTQSSGYREVNWFGDLVKYGANDQYATTLSGRGTEAINSSEAYPLVSTSVTNGVGWHCCPRSYTGLGGCVFVGHHHDYPKSGTTTWGGDDGALSYPHGPDGGLLLSPAWVHEPSPSNIKQAALRGTLPGGWAPLQGVFSHGDTFDGQGTFAGKKFWIGRVGTSARMAVEISDTWR